MLTAPSEDRHYTEIEIHNFNGVRVKFVGDLKAVLAAVAHLQKQKPQGKKKRS